MNGELITRAVIYARYSTDLQSPASIEDQIRLCRERLQRDGHELVKVYSDRAVSGVQPKLLSLTVHLSIKPLWLSSSYGAKSNS